MNQKPEIPILGPGGAAFLRLTLMDATGTMKSSGSLSTGSGTLIRNLKIAWRGQASPAFKAVTETAAGVLRQAPLHSKRVAVEFRTEAGSFQVEAKTQVTVIPGKDANAPADLVIRLACPEPQEGITLADLHAHLGKVGTVIVRAAKPKEGATPELGLEEAEDAHVHPLTLHAPGLPMATAYEADLTEVLDSMEADLAAMAPAAKKERKAPAVKRRKGGQALPN